jgi:hypothetical protein
MGNKDRDEREREIVVVCYKEEEERSDTSHPSLTRVKNEIVKGVIINFMFSFREENV